MANTESLNPKSNQIFCLVRKTWVKALPEEQVRQKLLVLMTQKLGFPASSLAVEKELRHMPHLRQSSQTIPQRRADILCFAPKIHPGYPLFPLLLIECKVIPLTEQVLRQVIGYNYFMQAPFIAVANREEVRTGWHDPEINDYRFISLIPSYQELLKNVTMNQYQTE